MDDYSKLGKWAKENAPIVQNIADNLAEAFPGLVDEKTKAELIYRLSGLAEAVKSGNEKELAEEQDGLRAFLAPLMQGASENHAVPPLDMLVSDLTEMVKPPKEHGRGRG